MFRRVHPEGSTIGDTESNSLKSHSGEFLRAKVSEPLDAQAFVGVRQAQLANYASVQEIGIGFLFRNSLLPKVLGSGVDYGFLELCSLFNNFRKSVGDFRSPYKEMDVSKGFGNMFNQVCFVI